MSPERKPLAVMESRDERITARFTASQRRELEDGARDEGKEVSRYIRECALMAHRIKQAQATLKATAV